MKKKISALMATAMVLGSLTACGTEPDNDKKVRVNEDVTEEVQELDAEAAKDEMRNSVKSAARVIPADTEDEDAEEDTEETDSKDSKDKKDTKETEDTDKSDDDDVSTIDPQAPVTTGNFISKMLDECYVDGQWTVPESIELTSDLKKLYNKIEGKEKEQYTPVALLNYQTSASDDICNYCFLCKGEVSGYEYWCLVYASEDEKGKVEFCNQVAIDLCQALESDFEPGDLQNIEMEEDIWKMPDDTEIPDDILDIYNKLSSPYDHYRKPLAYLGYTVDDGVTFHVLITESNLYGLGSNNALRLVYLKDCGRNLYIEQAHPSLNIPDNSECPVPFVEEISDYSSFIYTYGAWTVPSSMSLDMVPEECLEAIEDVEEGLYEPVSYVMYKEYLHPDYTSLVRVFLCNREGGFDTLVFVAEDEKGNVTVEHELDLDLVNIIDNGSVISPRDENLDYDGWEISGDGVCPDELIDAYTQYLKEGYHIAGFDKPEVLIATKTENGSTSYCFLAKTGLIYFGQNNNITMAQLTIDKKGNISVDSQFIMLDQLFRPELTNGSTKPTSPTAKPTDKPDSTKPTTAPDTAKPTSAPSGSTSDDPLEDPVIKQVYTVLMKYEPDLAEELLKEENCEYGVYYAVANDIEVVIETHYNEDVARKAWDEWADMLKDSIVFTEENYFLADSMADEDGFFVYGFVSGNDVVVIYTQSILKVTTTADIGDTLAKTIY